MRFSHHLKASTILPGPAEMDGQRAIQNRMAAAEVGETPRSSTRSGPSPDRAARRKVVA